MCRERAYAPVAIRKSLPQLRSCQCGQIQCFSEDNLTHAEKVDEQGDQELLVFSFNQGFEL